MSVHLMRLQKVFDVRWVFSSLTAVTALLTDFPALHSHFVACSSPIATGMGDIEANSRVWETKFVHGFSWLKHQ